MTTILNSRHSVIHKTNHILTAKTKQSLSEMLSNKVASKFNFSNNQYHQNMTMLSISSIVNKATKASRVLWTASAPQLKNIKQLLSTGGYLPDKVVVADIQASIAATCKRHWSQESTGFTVTTFALGTVYAPPKSISHDCCKLPWLLFQIDIWSITFMKNT